MANRAIQLRALAAADIDASIEHYRSEGGDRLSHAFIDAFEHAASQIRRSPHVGSLRFAYELDVPGLRAWKLKRFPYVVFYIASDDRIDIWRVLHDRRDIPRVLLDE